VGDRGLPHPAFEVPSRRQMPDVYANMTSAQPALVDQIARVLELRATDPQQRRMREAYLSQISLPQNARVLDVGCGTGAVTRMLADWPKVGQVVGVDPSPSFLEKARELAAGRANLVFQQADGRELPFEGDSFDLTLFHTTLCHVPSPERALAEAFRVLRPDGWLAVFDGDYATTTVAIGDSDPLQACVDAWVDSSVHDRWLLRRLPALARSSGFVVVSYQSHGYLQNVEPDYMMTIVSRGIDALTTSGRMGREVAASLLGEARRRAETGEFFGHIAYVSMLGRKEPRAHTTVPPNPESKGAALAPAT
jgi:ubiquinone/menaquinone biosynthesis C-methylase UbiE